MNSKNNKQKPVTRFRFKWSESNDAVSAIVTMDTWLHEKRLAVALPDETTKFELYAELHVVGMRGINGGFIPKLGKATREWLHLVARTYFHGRHGMDEPFIWLGLD